MNALTAADFLAETFEFELCAECGGDDVDHVAIMLDLGDYGANWFARCNRTLPDDEPRGPAQAFVAWSQEQDRRGDGIQSGQEAGDS